MDCNDWNELPSRGRTHTCCRCDALTPADGNRSSFRNGMFGETQAAVCCTEEQLFLFICAVVKIYTWRVSQLNFSGNWIQ